MEGWISLHRKILDNPIVCKDSDYFCIWCYLILNATHKEYDINFAGKRVTLKQGELITGRKSISEKFNIVESKVQRVLKKLEIEHQIEQQTSNKNRLISIVNWCYYQNSEQQNEQQVNNNRTTSEQQVNTNNNVNNINKSNNINKDIKPKKKKPFDDLILSYTKNLSLQKSLKDFTDMRKLIKKPLTESAFEKTLTKLDKLADNETDKMQILDNSVMNSWQGIFELKKEIVISKADVKNKKLEAIEKSEKETAERMQRETAEKTARHNERNGVATVEDIKAKLKLVQS